MDTISLDYDFPAELLKNGAYPKGFTGGVSGMKGSSGPGMSSASALLLGSLKRRRGDSQHLLCMSSES